MELLLIQFIMVLGFDERSTENSRFYQQGTEQESKDDNSYLIELSQNLEYLNNLNTVLGAPVSFIRRYKEEAGIDEYTAPKDLPSKENIKQIFLQIVDKVVEGLQQHCPELEQKEIEKYRKLMDKFIGSLFLRNYWTNVKDAREIRYINDLYEYEMVIRGKIKRKNEEIIHRGNLQGVYPDGYGDKSKEKMLKLVNVETEVLPELQEFIDWAEKEFAPLLSEDKVEERKNLNENFTKVAASVVAELTVLSNSFKAVTNEFPNELTLKIDEVIGAFRSAYFNIESTEYVHLSEDANSDYIKFKPFLEYVEELKDLKGRFEEYLATLKQRMLEGEVKIDPKFGNIISRGEKQDYKNQFIKPS